MCHVTICSHPLLVLVYWCYLFAKLCLTLCDPMGCYPPGSCVYGISQQKYWSGLPFPAPGNLLDSGIRPTSPALAGRFFTIEPPGMPGVGLLTAQSLQLCPTPCDPMDRSPTGSSVHGVFQARILELVAISSSRGSSQPRN